MRFGFAPLYNSFEDAWLAAEALSDVLGGRKWNCAQFQQRRTVT
jgi:kynureninase